MKVKLIIPPGTKDIWTNVPALKLDQKGGIWIRSRLVKNEHGYWTRVGRLQKIYYRD